MNDVLQLCRSDIFLSGTVGLCERNFHFPHHRPWMWQTTDVKTYMEAIKRDQNDEDDVTETAWHVLENRYLGTLRGVVSQITSHGCGDCIQKAKTGRSELSSVLASDQRLRDLAIRIADVAHSVNPDRLFAESLGESPYSHLSIVLQIGKLVPHVEFPVLTVLCDAYHAGMFPYGVFNMRLDASYDGPEVLMCLNPAALL